MIEYYVQRQAIVAAEQKPDGNYVVTTPSGSQTMTLARFAQLFVAVPDSVVDAADARIFPKELTPPAPPGAPKT